MPKPVGFANLSPSYKKHDLQQITIETKIAMRKKNRAEAEEYEKKMAKKKPKEGEEGEEGEEGGSGDEEVDEDEKERQRAKKEEQKSASCTQTDDPGMADYPKACIEAPAGGDADGPRC